MTLIAAGRDLSLDDLLKTPDALLSDAEREAQQTLVNERSLPFTFQENRRRVVLRWLGRSTS